MSNVPVSQTPLSAQPIPPPIPVPTQETTPSSILAGIFGDKCVVCFFFGEDTQAYKLKSVALISKQVLGSW